MWPFSRTKGKITNANTNFPSPVELMEPAQQELDRHKKEIEIHVTRTQNTRPYTPSLKEKLKHNRSNSKSGSGEKYWDSVIDVIENHYGKAS